jgi:hypothetical protein
MNANTPKAGGDIGKLSSGSFTKLLFDDPKSSQSISLCFMILILLVKLSFILGMMNYGKFMTEAYKTPRNEIKMLSGFLSYLRENRFDMPIVDIRLTKTTCPVFFTEIPLGDITLQRACEGIGFFSTNESLPRNCPYGARSPLHSLDLNNFKFWKEVKLCVQRVSSYSMITSGNCSTGFKKCGKTVCVPSKELCPLTKISKTDAEGAEKRLHFNGLTLYLHRTYDPELESRIISKIYVTNQDYTCMSLSTVPQCNFDAKLFAQDIKLATPECEPYGIDKDQESIDEFSASEFFSQNVDYESLKQSNALFTSYVS